jgi:hypothetical protein
MVISMGRIYRDFDAALLRDMGGVPWSSPGGFLPLLGSKDAVRRQLLQHVDGIGEVAGLNSSYYAKLKTSTAETFIFFTAP